MSFDVDANGILSVTALDKASSKSQKITITNDKGRLSKEEIERMVAEAEKYKAHDDNIRECLTARNGLESFLYQAKEALSGDQAKEALGDDLDQALETISSTTTWLEANQEATKEEYASKQEEVQAQLAPLMAKMQAGQVPGDMPTPADTTSGPTVEEVD